MNNIEEGILGEFVEALGPRRAGPMVRVRTTRAFREILPKVEAADTEH